MVICLISTLAVTGVLRGLFQGDVMIISKTSRKKQYSDIEPIYFEGSRRFSGDVMATNENGYRCHLKLSSLEGTSKEDEAFLRKFWDGK